MGTWSVGLTPTKLGWAYWLPIEAIGAAGRNHPLTTLTPSPPLCLLPMDKPTITGNSSSWPVSGQPSCSCWYNLDSQGGIMFLWASPASACLADDMLLLED